MLISYNWLQTYFDTKLPTPDELAEKLTFHSFEIEGVEKTENDTVIDVDVLPNRAHDCLSHRGIAKELSAILNIPFTNDPLEKYGHGVSIFGLKTGAVEVHVEDAMLCPRFTGAVIRGVEVGSSPEWLRRSLEAVVKGEKLKVEKGVLEEIGGVVDGSFREAMKILEQLSLAKGKISLDLVRAEVGKSDATDVKKLLGLLKKRDLKKALGELDSLSEAGVNWEAYLRELLLRLRDILMEEVMGGSADWSRQEILELIEKLSKAGRDLKTASVAQLPLEIAVVEWCSNQDLGFRIQDLGTKKIYREPTRTDPVGLSGGLEGGFKPSRTEPVGGSGVVDFAEVENKWNEVLIKVKPFNHSVEGLLRSARPAGISGDKLKVEVFYQFHLDQLKQDKYLKMVEQALEAVFATRLRLEYHLGKRLDRSEVAKVENIKATNDEEILKVAEEVFGDVG